MHYFFRTAPRYTAWCLVKRSRALRRRNPTRDSQDGRVDDAPGPWPKVRARFLGANRTPAYASKILPSGAGTAQNRPQILPKTLN